MKLVNWPQHRRFRARLKRLGLQCDRMESRNPATDAALVSATVAARDNPEQLVVPAAVCKRLELKLERLKRKSK